MIQEQGHLYIMIVSKLKSYLMVEKLRAPNDKRLAGECLQQVQLAIHSFESF